MLYDNNGKCSSSKCEKQINIRYLFIKDRINKKTVRTKCYLTDILIVDFYANSLQAYKFYELRNQALNFGKNTAKKLKKGNQKVASNLTNKRNGQYCE